ncbi:DoxX family protein [Streptomyces sp. NPDC001339]|uniref:DoxX family protein n=1 Tax=Streptomyces sp. NPDC001339 TaxID=3364563 RepID=UPI00368A5D82
MKLLAERPPGGSARSRTSRSRSLGADLGLLLLRLSTGLIMAGHGAQKLFGLFGGPGLTGSGKVFTQYGYHPGELFAGIAGASELLGGLGLAVGLFTPLAAAAVLGVMINAMALAAPYGLWVNEGGMELPLIIGAATLTVAAVGPGRFALDRPFRWREGGLASAAFALGLGGLGAAIVMVV